MSNGNNENNSGDDSNDSKNQNNKIIIETITKNVTSGVRQKCVQSLKIIPYTENILKIIAYTKNIHKDANQGNESYINELLFTDTQLLPGTSNADI